MSLGDHRGRRCLPQCRELTVQTGQRASASHPL